MNKSLKKQSEKQKASFVAKYEALKEINEKMRENKNNANARARKYYRRMGGSKGASHRSLQVHRQQKQ